MVGIVELISEQLHRTLTYIFAVNRAGAALTLGQLEAYAVNPSPTQRRTRNIAESVVSQYMSLLEHEVVPRESVGSFLTRVQWIEDRAGVQLTALGRAVLQYADRQPLADVSEEPLMVTIDPDDRLAYTRIFDLMSSYGEGLLVDKYLNLEGLGDVMSISSVDRLLTSDDARRNRLTLFGRALGTDEDSPSLRTLPAARLHDRFFIPDDGPVFALGSSLNSISARPGVVTTIADSAAQAIREMYERLWGEGEVVSAVLSDGNESS